MAKEAALRLPSVQREHTSWSFLNKKNKRRSKAGGELAVVNRQQDRQRGACILLKDKTCKMLISVR